MIKPYTSLLVLLIAVFVCAPFAYAEEAAETAVVESTVTETTTTDAGATESTTGTKPKPMMKPMPTPVQKKNLQAVPPMPPSDRKIPEKVGPGVACPMNYAPVCGTDGVTYGNDCMAKGAGVEIAKRGTCDGSDNLNPKPLPPRLKDGPPPRVASTSPGVTEQVKSRAEDKVKESVKRTTTLILANIDRLEKLIVRILSRADKLDEKGVDTSSARTDLAAAQVELDAAKSDLNGITPTALQILETRSLAAVSTAVSDARAAFDSARSHLKNARDLIESAVKKLVGTAAPQN